MAKSHGPKLFKVVNMGVSILTIKQNTVVLKVTFFCIETRRKIKFHKSHLHFFFMIKKIIDFPRVFKLKFSIWEISPLVGKVWPTEYSLILPIFILIVIASNSHSLDLNISTHSNGLLSLLVCKLWALKNSILDSSVHFVLLLSNFIQIYLI